MVFAVVLSVVSAALGQQVLFDQQTDPPGLFSTSVYVSAGSSVVTSNAPATLSGYSFTHWTIDGVRQNDVTGRSLNPAGFVIVQDTHAVAHYTNSVSDLNNDGVPDWFEIMFYGGITNLAATDLDGDGASVLTEYNRDTHPRLEDRIVSGGVSRRRGDPVTMLVAPNYSFYFETSTPPGFVSSQIGVSNGTVMWTSVLHGDTNGYSFAYWDINGTRQTDISGVALARASVVVTNTTVATAHYVSTTSDIDGNGLPDWWELAQTGAISNNPAADADGDGASLLTEYNRDTSPLINDRIVAGGVSRRRSDLTSFSMAGYCRYDIQSSPAGLISQQGGIVATGTVVTTPSLNGEISGYTFGFWTVNGVRQADMLGRSASQFSLVATGDVACVANYFSTSSDSDGDGLPDWWEWLNFGVLSNVASSDPNADGTTLLSDYNLDLAPQISNRLVAGGVSRRRSEFVTLNLQAFTPTTDILVNGTRRSFFSSTSTTNNGMNFVANTAPALGDWNGDGVVDLFVGSSNGVLRVYENTGSPIVPNLVERTTNFSPWAWAWSGIPNPAPALGDWSGDGKADLALGGDTNFIVLLASPGNFSGAPLLTNALTVTSTSAIPALADVTGDGRAELFVLLADGTVNLYTNSGNAGAPFTGSAVRSNLLPQSVPNATGLAVADTQGLGIMSVLVSDVEGRIWEFRPDGAGNYTLASKVFAGSYAGLAHRLTIAVNDVDGDGDLDVIGGFAEGGLVYLKNPAQHLVVSPPSATVSVNQPVSFSALNGSGAVTWSLVRNNSGASLGASSGAYLSGTNGGTMDTVEGVDAVGLRGRAYVNVINPADLASFGKAIVIGGGKDLTDPVWLASDYIANKAYNVLRYKGYDRANIRYLSFNPGRDIDGDGLTNDIAGFSSFTNAAFAFTNWVGNANRLFVYLVDHGAATPDGAYFRLNTGENLNSAQLNTWLTALQNQYHTEVVVVLDFCYAGRFLQDLAYAGPAKRVVLAATSPNELTYFLSGGYVSFSDLFLSGLMQGMDLQQSFLLAQSGMQAYQSATLDDTGDGLYQTNVDGDVASTIPIGATRLAGKDVPIIGGVAPSQSLTSGTTATLWAERIQSYYPLSRAYATVLPPSFTANTNVGVPVTGVSEVELQPDASGHYQTNFNGFTESGAYRINYYARDIWGSVSPPQAGLVLQSSFDERMILVTGGSTNDAQWNATANMSVTAYRTALARRLPKDHLQCLSAVASQDYDGDGTNDVNAMPTLATLGNAITNWASPASKLTVYLIGSTVSNGLYRLSNGETLSPAQLDNWLDSLQQTNRSVNVVLDHDNSGGYVGALTSSAGRERIVIASTTSGSVSLRASSGLVSFSQFFLNGILNGQSLGAAFNAARNPVRYASGLLRQAPQLDDTGNGLANEKNLDGLVAAVRYLGGAFATGEDAPFIGAVTPSTNIVLNTPVLLWAQGILSGVGISNVWCVITPPDYTGVGDLPQTNLTWNAGTGRYEVVYPCFALPGTYVCTFFARDNSGQVSAAKQCEITVTDAFEPDDMPLLAGELPLSVAQTHNFHSELDEDWVRFYAPTGYVYELTAEQLGTNSDVALDLYFEQADGSLALVDWIDEYGWGIGETEMLTLDLKTGTNELVSGIYYLRVSSTNTNRFGQGSEYQVQIYCPVGGAGGVVLINNPGGYLSMGSFNVYLGAPPALAAGAGWWLVQLTNEISYFSDNAGIYSVPASTNYMLTFKPIPGFAAPTNRPLAIYADQVTSVMAYYLYTNQSPRALSPVLSTNGTWQLTFLGTAGKRYALEESTNLVNWVSMVTNQVPADGLMRFSRTNNPATLRGFCRTRWVP